MTLSMQAELIKITSGSVHVEGMLELIANPIGVALFAHGSGSSRFSPRNNYVANALRDAQIGTFLMDLLTPQEEQNYEMRFNISLLTQRLGTAIEWLQQNDSTKCLPLGLFGASTGAAAALQVAAARAGDIAALVSRGGRPDMAGRQALEKVRAPTLLIVGGFDDVVVELNRMAYTTLQCEKRLDIIPGATHLFEEPGALETVAMVATEWFMRHFVKSN